jgi:hypothetical protein
MNYRYLSDTIHMQDLDYNFILYVTKYICEQNAWFNVRSSIDKSVCS